MKSLPWEVRTLLKQLDASPRLVAHLTLVHDVAFHIASALERTWPDLRYDREAVLLGAATHDIGKAVHRGELCGPGRQHERAGVALLMRQGFSAAQARFARTHGEWNDDPTITLEDLLVALADKVWKGQRDAELEDMLVRHVARLRAEEPWETYIALDEALMPIAQAADVRLTWQARYPV